MAGFAMLRRLIWALMVPLALAACGAEPRWAPDDAVRRAQFVSNDPPSITLYTVIGIPRGEGGHSALMINGSQRVMFDPAGSFYHPDVPERNDVLYGITENIRRFYIDYHARETYWVEESTIPVSRAVADRAIAAAQANGAANKSFCANNTAAVLRQVPGFEDAPHTMFPLTLRAWFNSKPGAKVRRYDDGDPAITHNVTLVPEGDPRATALRRAAMQ